VPDWKPRKLPRQARSRVTVDAILEACARLLERDGYAALTTNHVARRAGVSIGTLYEFFPNREAIVLALARKRLERLAEEVRAGLVEAEGRDAGAALDLLIRGIVRAVAADRALYRVLLRELRGEGRETRRALGAFLELGRVAGERARDRVSLPDPPADAWLIGRMLAQGVLEIAWLERGDLSRERLTRELVRLSHRMIHGRDLER